MARGLHGRRKHRKEGFDVPCQIASREERIASDSSLSAVLKSKHDGTDVTFMLEDVQIRTSSGQGSDFILSKK